MYRYGVDKTVTYTSLDVNLFRESPFACWMERLTLENPDHGIPPDLGSGPPQEHELPQEDLADTLHAEGRNVVVVDRTGNEPARRSATLAAMRRGADFIVNGQLAVATFSDSVNLLMRASGRSELGDYLYIPCDTRPRTRLNSAFRLCFMADLLHNLQGQLPPQLLLIRGDSDLVPLQTEDHIYHYRAVKQRFMAAMCDFRKHRMPDPAGSAHFGRWGGCANEVLKQRALRQEGYKGSAIAENELPLPQVASGDCCEPRPAIALRLEIAQGAACHFPAETAATLAEQARLLVPGTFRADRPRSPVLAGRFADLPAAPGRRGSDERGSAEVPLQNLEFIGSSTRAPSIGAAPSIVAHCNSPAASAPSPRLRNPLLERSHAHDRGERSVADHSAAARMATGGSGGDVMPACEGSGRSSRAVVDLGETSPPMPATSRVACTAEGKGDRRPPAGAPVTGSAAEEGAERGDRRFSNSLITSGVFDD
jgi:hypothetical protein